MSLLDPAQTDVIEPGTPTSPPTPLEQAGYKAFADELSLRFHNYVDAIETIGEAAAYERFLRRWEDIRTAYSKLDALIQAELS